MQERFWRLFGTGLPYILGGIFLFNIISFGLINRPYFNWAYEGVLQRLPTNGLVDLYATSGTPIRTEWIYAVIENYYQGQTVSTILRSFPGGYSRHIRFRHHKQ